MNIFYVTDMLPHRQFNIGISNETLINPYRTNVENRVSS